MLTPLEEDKLQALLTDEVMLKIIEKIFNLTLDNNLPQVHLLDDNLKIGEKYRAYEEAKGIIRIAFTDLLSYKRETNKQKEIANKAR